METILSFPDEASFPKMYSIGIKWIWPGVRIFAPFHSYLLFFAETRRERITQPHRLCDTMRHAVGIAIRYCSFVLLDRKRMNAS